MSWHKIAERANRRVMSAFSEQIVLSSGQVIEGVFDRPTEEGRLKSLQLEGVRPVLTLHDADAAPLKINEVLTVRGQRYTVLKKLPDDTGFTVVHLAETQSTKASDWL